MRPSQVVQKPTLNSGNHGKKQWHFCLYFGSSQHTNYNYLSLSQLSRRNHTSYWMEQTASQKLNPFLSYNPQQKCLQSCKRILITSKFFIWKKNHWNVFLKSGPESWWKYIIAKSHKILSYFFVSQNGSIQKKKIIIQKTKKSWVTLISWRDT